MDRGTMQVIVLLAALVLLGAIITKISYDGFKASKKGRKKNDKRRTAADTARTYAVRNKGLQKGKHKTKRRT